MHAVPAPLRCSTLQPPCVLHRLAALSPAPSSAHIGHKLASSSRSTLAAHVSGASAEKYRRRKQEGKAEDLAECTLKFWKVLRRKEHAQRCKTDA